MSFWPFRFDLPAEKIAEHPAKDRSASRLLVARCMDRSLSHHCFNEIASLLPERCTLVLNKTRVINARLPVKKRTGGSAEVFLLGPLRPSKNLTLALQSCGSSTWECLIGGKNIQAGDVLVGQTPEGPFSAEILSKTQAHAEVLLRWDPPHWSTAQFLEHAGQVPLPPYIKRPATKLDRKRYQTVYASHPGSVAAPTAGLHFTNEILETLQRQGTTLAELTLHVGAGTFQPITAKALEDHQMHAEPFCIDVSELEKIVQSVREGRPIVCVGTTSLRALESLFWMGARHAFFHTSSGEEIDQWIWKNRSLANVPIQTAWDALLQMAQEKNPSIVSDQSVISRQCTVSDQQSSVSGLTRLMIVPGYSFRTCTGLITNFHQPHSSLLLLVAAFLGPEFCEHVYQSALAEGYRFLSYGDSSLLLRHLDKPSSID